MEINNQYQCILYSGSSHHIINNINLLYYREKIKENMYMEKEYIEKCEIKGKVKLQVHQKTII